MADGYGLMLFLNAIGEVIKGASTLSIAPVWERELLSARSPPRITCTHNEYEPLELDNQSTTNPQDDNILTSIFFGPKEIQALRNQLPTNQTQSPTRFELITACLWKCRTIAFEPNPNDITRISFVMNARQKKEMNLPIGYYGNGIVYPAAISKAGILCESPLTYALNLVRSAKAQLSEEYVRSVADLMVIKGRPKYVTRLNYMVTDITGLGFDKLDLGWGKPLFGGVSRAPSIISFYASSKNYKEKDGVVVPISLPPLALKKFQDELHKMICGPISKI
ncbi:benzyl alcohol O-benzoyltransferase [Handroanthus impetiginosus]|uniref:Benzyl alcohol O-benzoyltransferase n=1 Tax=Handroanthus impetiginosus TaxID=429701 RepID=A0A2G9HPB9_9LAMI|nr:benzyl alcohol O-benzoyltransferase [Handroanthus impetiginosus]